MFCTISRYVGFLRNLLYLTRPVVINSSKYMVQIMSPEVVILIDHIGTRMEHQSTHLAEQAENAPFVISYRLHEAVL